MDLRAVLTAVVERGASDLHLKAGRPPHLRVDGTLQAIDAPPASAQELVQIAKQLLTPEQHEEFESSHEIDFAFGIAGLARFRSNFFHQRGTLAMVFRRVSGTAELSLEALNLPEVLANISRSPRGLVLVTGTVGSGKSTTLASMLHFVNSTQRKNIITLEDPIEHLFVDDQSYISQREIGLDTHSFHEGLRHILRQDPDVIMIGEIRDRTSMEIALTAADTGHLVLSTLHTIDATETIQRALSFYPPHEHQSVRYLLATTLKSVISQRLIPRKDGPGRIPAVEVLINTRIVGEAIVDETKTHMIPQFIQEGTATHGMQSFDQALMQHYSRGRISLDTALEYCSNPTEFDLRVKGIHASSDGTWDRFEMTG